MIYTIHNAVLTLCVDSAGGNMTSIRYFGEERQWQGGEFWKSRDVVIFPVVGHADKYTVCGKTYTPKSHGVARYAEFSLSEQTESSLTLTLSSDEETKKTYPYDFVLSVSYELKENSIAVVYRVRAKEGTIPFYVGGHPGMKAPGGSAIVEFENEENPVLYPLDSGEAVQLKKIKRFVADKNFFAECKTFQLGGLSGGAIYVLTQDGFRYAYRSDCPVFAFWSNENGGDYLCVEPWWGINDYPSAPRELSLKPFMNFAGKDGKSFSYVLTLEKSGEVCGKL